MIEMNERFVKFVLVVELTERGDAAVDPVDRGNSARQLDRSHVVCRVARRAQHSAPRARSVHRTGVCRLENQVRRDPGLQPHLQHSSHALGIHCSQVQVTHLFQHSKRIERTIGIGSNRTFGLDSSILWVSRPHRAPAKNRPC